MHIYYILWGKNSKFGVWMHLGMAERCIPFSGLCDLDLNLWLSFYSNHNVRLSVRPSVPLRVQCISPLFFEVGNPNLMCGCILGWRSFAYHFRVTLTLTSDLVFRIIVSEAYLILFEVGISNLVCGCILRWGSVAYHNWVAVTLNLISDLVSRNFIASGAYSYILWDRNSKFGV